MILTEDIHKKLKSMRDWKKERWEKDLAKESLKDVTMERVKVEEFEESLCKDCGRVNQIGSVV